MDSNSFRLFKDRGLPYFKRGMRVLEVGPDKEGGPDDKYSLKRLMPEGVEYWTADILDSDSPFFIPVETGGYEFLSHGYWFDIVFSANVIEHVPQVWKWMKELTRITKRDGYVITVNPVSWPYHEAPVDCWRLYPEAYKALFEYAGLDHVESSFGTFAEIDEHWREEHGPHPVVSCIAVGKKA